MYFDRVGAKRAARESIRTTRPSPLLVTLVYYLLTNVLYAVIILLTQSHTGGMLDAVREFMLLLQSGYGLEELVPYIVGAYGGSILTFILIQLLWSVYSSVMSFGYTSYALRLSRNEQPELARIFDGFARPFRVLAAALLTELLTLLWGVIFALPASMLLLVVGVAAGGEAMTAASILLMPMVSIAALVISLRYSLTSYFLLDDPGCTAVQAIRRSVEAMRGWKMSLFSLELSFLGWAILSQVLSGLVSLLLPLDDVLSVWVLPYYGAAEAVFYDTVTAPSRQMAEDSAAL